MNYVSADIHLIVNNASRYALRQKSKITMEILKGIIKQTRPSLTSDDLEKYEKIRDKMECKEVNEQKRKLGF